MHKALLAFSLLVLALLGGCGGTGSAPGTGHATRVRILAVDPNVGRALFEISCPTKKGDRTSSVKPCAELAENPELVTKPEPFICMMGENMWDFAISGQVNGRPVRSHTASCWTRQMALIGKLGLDFRSHLLPRLTVSMVGPASRVFPPGALNPADLVTCKIHGTHLGLGVPIKIKTTAEESFDGPHIMSRRLEVTRYRDGSVAARCYYSKPLPKESG